MAQLDYIIGCPDPYSIAEMNIGKRINWAKQSDEFDMLAKCFGITKEGFLSDESPLDAPFIAVDSNGNPHRLSEEEAEKRLVSFMKKYARPERRKKVAATVDAEAFSSGRSVELTPAQKRSRAVEILLQKNKVVSDQTPISKRAVDDAASPEGNDVPPYLPQGMEWRDKGYFFNETVLWSDVCQNSIGDCYFLAALCSVAYVAPFFIKNQTGLRYKWKDGEQTFAPWHLIEFYVPNGNYESSQAWNKKKKTVQSIVVSEEVLVDSKTGFNFGASGPKEKQIVLRNGKITGTKADWDACWPAVYEKAYAKFLENSTSDYPNMNTTSGLESHIVGGVAEAALKEIIHTEDVKVDYLSNISVDRIWDIGMAARSHPSCASIYKFYKTDGNGNTIEYAKAGTKSDYLNMGLYISHAYSFLGVYHDNGTKYLVLRNPHGRNLNALKNNPKVYHGNWGFNYGADPEDKFDNRWDVFRQITGNDDPQNSNGVFLLEINEFKRVFTTVEYYTGNAFSGTFY